MNCKLKEKVDKVYTELCLDSNLLMLSYADRMTYLFTRIYGVHPQIVHISGYTLFHDIDEYDECESEEANSKLDTVDVERYPLYIEADKYDFDKSVENIIETYKDDGYFLDPGTLFTEDFIVNTRGSIYFKDASISDKILPLLIEEEDNPIFQYASCGTNGRFYTRSMKVKELSHSQEEFLSNYNDDFPLDRFNEFINSEYSGIVILYGTPGCGKSSAIRHLISTNPKQEFVWLDQTLLSQVTSASFVDFLFEHRHSTFILEDCEALLQDRNITGNNLISSLLNLSDGILGDSLDIKFICTFNTDLKNIDQAILRKGRLKLKYEFKPLKKEKVAAIFNKLGISDAPKELPLCDVYNYKEDNGVESKKKIGF